MLSALKATGKTIGLISNCSAEEIDGFTNCDVYRYLDAAVFSCDTGMVKPDAEIYEHCAALLNVKLCDCYYVGDGGSNELYGAARAGMTPLKAAWFIKRFLVGYDADKTYPMFMDTQALYEYIVAHRI